MECSMCTVRGAVSFCEECQRMLCEVCNFTCAMCEKVVCREHRESTPGGRDLCATCMEERNQIMAKRRERREHVHEDDRHDGAPVDLHSVEDEIYDLDALRRELGHDDTAIYAAEKRLKKKQEEEYFRPILVKSAPKGFQTWLFCVLVSLGCIFVVIVVSYTSFIFLSMGVRILTSFLSFIVIILASAGAIKKGRPEQRRRYVVGIVSGLLSLAVALYAG